MTAYFAPSNTAVNITWNGASYYTAPSGSSLNFDFTVFAYPKIVGGTDFGFANSTEALFKPPPYTIVGNVDLAFTPESWMTQYQLMSIEGALFDVGALQGSMVIGYPESFNLEALLAGLQGDFLVLNPLQIDSTLPSLNSEFVLYGAGNYQVDAILAGFQSTVTVEPRGVVEVSNILAGLRSDLALYAADGVTIEGALLPSLTLKFEAAGDYQLDSIMLRLTADVSLSDGFDVGGKLPILQADIAVVPTTDIAFSGLLALPTGALSLEAPIFNASARLPGFTATIWVSPQGEMQLTDALPGLKPSILFDPPELVDVTARLPGLSFEGFISNGLAVDAVLPHLRGVREFDTTTTCRTRYL